jgi:ATP-dependent RNA helicase DeaD
LHTDFHNFGLEPKLQQALARLQFTTPTPIQQAAIPLALAGRDVLGTAQTGTGKTIAFGIPVIQYLMLHPDGVALILTPTRELAAQVQAALLPLVPLPNIKAALLIGGEPMPRQLRQLQQKPRLIIGTPGRINDHLLRRNLQLGKTGMVVLDETDRMLDMGFGVQIDKILQHVPKDRQSLLFSATLPPEITRIANKYMRNPERVAAGSVERPIAKISQELVHTTDADKYADLTAQLSRREGSVIIFVKTKHGSERLAKKLCQAEFRADAIHGDLKQNRRDRVIRDFRAEKFRILVATDVAARGLDIPHIAHVINYDLPQSPEDYIHRIGRTARAGAEGSALNLLTPADRDKWRAIQRLLGGSAQDNQSHAKSAPKSGGSFKKNSKPPHWRDRKSSASGDKKPIWNKESASGEQKPRWNKKPIWNKESAGEQKPRWNKKPIWNKESAGEQKTRWDKKSAGDGAKPKFPRAKFKGQKKAAGGKSYRPRG